MFTDFVLNGEGRGEVGSQLQGVRFDPGLLRPYFDSHGVPCVTVNTGRLRESEGGLVPVLQKWRVEDVKRRLGIDHPVLNATGLRKEQWIQMDTAIIRAARPRLSAWGDLMQRSSYGGFNAMAKLTLEYEVMSDPGEAVVDMEGLAQGRTDSPLFKLRSLPLPITHSDFVFSMRRLAVSRNGDTPLDTTMGEAAGRRVAEMVEKTLIGVETGVTYGTQSAGYGTHDNTSAVYGYTNLPVRITKTNLTIPTGSNPEATVADLLSMRESMYTRNFYGPFMVYTSTDWDYYLDNDYARLGGANANMTLRDRLLKIGNIIDIKRLDYLTSTFTLIMVQMVPETVQAIDGMGITTVQWESRGGMQQNFKVMCIQVPRFRYDYNGVAAVIHATTA